MHWSRGWFYTVHLSDHALITWLIIHCSRSWSCTDYVAIMQCSRGWSCNDHVANMYWSRDWSCNGNVIDHALITWLIMHWLRGYHALLTWLILQWSCSYHVPVTWLIMHWSLNWSCTDNEGDHTLITWLIIHWSCDWSCTDHVAIMHCSRGYNAMITWISYTDPVPVMHRSRD